MDHYEFDFIISPFSTEHADIIIASIANMGFESFSETEKGILAYIPVDLYQERLNQELDALSFPDFNIIYQKKLMAAQNWNEVWESNFQPILIAGKCYIRAAFHKKMEIAEYDILIQPKMSFGTGHHATTSLMMTEMLKMNFKEMKVADIGCGTGILAVLASKMGAKNVEAVDIDEWAFENTKENYVVNKVSNIRVHKGEAGLLSSQVFNIILANINKNVLLSDIKMYSHLAAKNSNLLLSGFYKEDRPEILKEAEKHGFKIVSTETESNWCMLHLRKT